MSGDISLDAVRRDIDDIDDMIHALIVKRTALVEKVRTFKRDWPVKIQPSREAEIVYRLVSRHSGPFPKRELVAIWRQLITATLAFEGPFSVAVYMPGNETTYWDLGRDQYGTYTPMSRHRSVRTVIEAVRRQTATVGVLPMPRHDDPDPWWRHLVTNHPEVPRIIARLPFAGPGNAISGEAEALVICPVPLKPTGRDCSYLAVDANSRIGANQFSNALEIAGFKVEFATAWREEQRPRNWLYLSEVDGLVRPEDVRLSVLSDALGSEKLNQLVLLGGYAKPLSAAELGPIAVALEHETPLTSSVVPPTH